MSNNIFIQKPDGKIQKFEGFPTIDLNACDIDAEEIPFASGESVEMSIQNDDTDIMRDILRAILPQGEYNSLVLKRDGYLSPENGWLSE